MSNVIDSSRVVTNRICLALLGVVAVVMAIVFFVMEPKYNDTVSFAGGDISAVQKYADEPYALTINGAKIEGSFKKPVQVQNVIIVGKNDAGATKYGGYNLVGQNVIPFVYDKMPTVLKEYLKFYQEGLCRVYDNNGVEVFKPKFAEVKDIAEGLAIVSDGKVSKVVTFNDEAQEVIGESPLIIKLDSNPITFSVQRKVKNDDKYCIYSLEGKQIGEANGYFALATDAAGKIVATADKAGKNKKTLNAETGK